MMLKGLLVTVEFAVLGLLAMSVYAPPWSTERPVKVARPFTAVTVAVPLRVPFYEPCKVSVTLSLIEVSNWLVDEEFNRDCGEGLAHRSIGRLGDKLQRVARNTVISSALSSR